MATETEAEKAIVAHLVREPGLTSTSQTSPSGWTASTVVGGGPGADPSSIVFQKTRVLPTCQAHSVSFTNRKGMPMALVIRTWQEPDGAWVVAPVGGGSPGPSRRTKPWVNFTAGFGAAGFVAGGYLEGAGSELARSVRLTFANGIVVEDRVDNEIVLYFEPRPVTFPADAEILAGQGTQLASYKAFDGFPFVSG